MILEANDPNLSSWIDVPKDSDFPIQNLPFGIFSTSQLPPRTGVAIGNKILDLSALTKREFLDSISLPSRVFEKETLNEFIDLGREKAREVRNHISLLLQKDNAELRDRDYANSLFVDQSDAEMLMPIKVGDYTDFYSSEQHAQNVGTLIRDPENALLPNWKHLPVGYHGRASSIVVSGTPVIRPKGQTKPKDMDEPMFGPCKLLDFELEVAFVTCKNNELGNTVSTAEAEDFIFGFVLFNDWSARDMQTWEYQPLGPFLAKNFASTISPWIVTLDALEPFRVAGSRQDPEVFPYLQFDGDKNFDVNLEVSIAPDGSEETTVCKSNFKYMYWNVNQQLAHHTVNGCNVGSCDMYASGTISGPQKGMFGSMLEISWRGTQSVQMADGSERKFIKDGDTVVMRGHAEKDGIRVGFGEVSAKVLPAK
jgi:fumarylacetoacetase